MSSPLVACRSSRDAAVSDSSSEPRNPHPTFFQRPPTVTMAPKPFLALRAAALRSSRPSHIGVSLLHSSAIRYNAAAPTQSALEKTLRDALKTAMKSKDKPAATCLKVSR